MLERAQERSGPCDGRTSSSPALATPSRSGGPRRAAAPPGMAAPHARGVQGGVTQMCSGGRERAAVLGRAWCRVQQRAPPCQAIRDVPAGPWRCSRFPHCGPRGSATRACLPRAICACAAVHEGPGKLIFRCTFQFHGTPQVGPTGSPRRAVGPNTARPEGPGVRGRPSSAPGALPSAPRPPLGAPAGGTRGRHARPRSSVGRSTWLWTRAAGRCSAQTATSSATAPRHRRTTCLCHQSSRPGRATRAGAAVWIRRPSCTPCAPVPRRRVPRTCGGVSSRPPYSRGSRWHPSRPGRCGGGPPPSPRECAPCPTRRRRRPGGGPRRRDTR